MKVLKYAVATLFVVGAGAFALASCGPGGSCESDTDCSGDEVCSASGQCLVNCTEDDAACTNQEVCQEVPSGKKGCFSDPGGDDAGDTGGDAGMDDTDGGGGGGEAPYFVQIKDVTRSEAPEGARVCDAGDDGSIDTAGADISAVQLLDGNGEAIAWGTDDIANKFTNVNKYTDAPTVLDGTAPSLRDGGEGGECAAGSGDSNFTGSTVVALGCKGSVIVGFKDENGEYIPIKEGYEIAVYEYDVQCFNCYPDCPDEADFKQEAVEVKTCAPTDDPSSQEGELFEASFDSDGNLSQCQNSLGTGIGAVVPFSYSP